MCITRLTLKCWSNIIFGLNYDKYESLLGPAATGKTESVIDLASIMGS